jgi:hypothetical protein
MGPFKPVGRARPVRAHGKGFSWLRHDGVTAPIVLDGPMDSPHFLAYVEQVLAPTLKKDQIVFLDNVSIMRSKGSKKQSRLAALVPLSCRLTARIAFTRHLRSIN